ncbi:MAG: hypothetical protein A2161_01475, partial [Candidatus Schekmanbacteria bacterium RBG_13_48_7]
MIAEDTHADGKLSPVFLSIVLPAYNEENRIPVTLDKIFSFLHSRRFTWELIIVDDGSIDSTVEVINKSINKVPNARLLENKINRGKGFSVKRGMLAANGDYCLFSDADLSTPIEFVEIFLEYHQQGYDVCIGSRSLPDSNIEIHQPWYREKMGKIFGVLQRIFLLDKIIDSQCGFKSFNRRAAEFIFPRQVTEGFCFDVEILYIAQKHDFKIREIPVTWR